MKTSKELQRGETFYDQDLDLDIKILLKYGDWILDDLGYVSHIGFPHSPTCSYDIKKDRLFNEMDWLDHLKRKIWFDEKCEKDFTNIVNYIKK